MCDFAGKTIIVTGAGAGIGRASAIAFARRGAKRIIINSASRSCEDTVIEIRKLGADCISVIGDIGKKETVDRLFAGIDSLDVLVNCAGIVPQGDLLSTDLEQWDVAFDTNVKSIFMTCRAAVSLMQKSGGAIVNVASVAGFKGIKNRALYSATKGAVIALTKSMAVEYVQNGIRINSVSPGTVLSPSLQARIDTAVDPIKEKRMFDARQPIGRLGTPEEIAEAILFLASPANSYMVGENLVCDGGATT